MTKLDRVLDRQRKTTTRDIAIGAIAAAILVFQVFAFSSTAGEGNVQGAVTEQSTPAARVVDVITSHTAQVCGTIPSAEMRC